MKFVALCVNETQGGGKGNERPLPRCNALLRLT